MRNRSQRDRPSPQSGPSGQRQRSEGKQERQPEQTAALLRICSRRPDVGNAGGGRERGYERTYKDISDALMAHEDIEASDIEIGVVVSAVKLCGSVDSRQTKRAAENLVERFRGVNEVENSLRVKSKVSGRESDSSDLPSATEKNAPHSQPCQPPSRAKDEPQPRAAATSAAGPKASAGRR